MFGGARTCDCFVHLPTNPATREPTSVTKFSIFAFDFVVFIFIFLKNNLHFPLPSNWVFFKLQVNQSNFWQGTLFVLLKVFFK